ncbi:GNAT family N-acetyltransferase [Calothrix sp. NIES-2098]|uniref:GNAT family N-acetyltransferase n=1 Tax=Calothrix sp. NIES-2098 TaxID=1954171 RepID=UPI000B608DB2|nr:GCN5-related N-acetyltransferase [Calothrix sp. NIES-2098]
MLPANIRKATESDAQAIAQILQELGWFAWLDSTSPQTTIRQIQQHITQCHANDSHSIYVAENAETQVVGYVAVHWLPCPFLPKPQAYISELFIHKAYRGKGIGKRLLETVTSEALMRGCLLLMLHNHKERESYQREFYRKQGWIERENIANFIYRLN